jgi:hypothetical protein
MANKSMRLDGVRLARFHSLWWVWLKRSSNDIKLHLQNHCHDPVGVGGENCGGGEVDVFYPLLRQNQKVTIFAA